MDLVVVGSSGMLGQDLVSIAKRRGHRVTELSRSSVDISDPEACLKAVPYGDAVINCAAYTAVDAAEAQEAYAFSVNAIGAANLARIAALRSMGFFQVSTDYVFSGDVPGELSEDSVAVPRSAYGRSKVAGEWAALALHPSAVIVRTGWLYGQHGPCFPKTVRRILASRGSITVVEDQFGQPTWTADLSDLLLRLVTGRVPKGIYHGTSSGRASWFTFAQEVAESAGFSRKSVIPTTSEEFMNGAPRPSNSVLGHEALIKLGIRPIGDWRSCWQRASAQIVS